MKKLRIVFDLDLTLCTGKPYETAQPYVEEIQYLRKLKRAGHTIIIYTARNMGDSVNNPGRAIANIGRLTLEQLDRWGVPYDEVYFGKPSGDLYVDDKALDSVRALQELLEMED